MKSKRDSNNKSWYFSSNILIVNDKDNSISNIISYLSRNRIINDIYSIV